MAFSDFQRFTFLATYQLLVGIVHVRVVGIEDNGIEDNVFEHKSTFIAHRDIFKEQSVWKGH